jgi:uncharacterized protein (TIGR02300 family)
LRWGVADSTFTVRSRAARGEIGFDSARGAVAKAASGPARRRGGRPIVLTPEQEVVRVAKPEWGTKRICHNCGARFYDLHRSPIVCPKCGTPFDPEALLKSRRSRSALVADMSGPKTPARGKAKPVADEAEEEALVEVEDTEEVAAEETESEESGESVEGMESEEESYGEEDSEDAGVLLEDASELGDDEVMVDLEESDDDNR